MHDKQSQQAFDLAGEKKKYYQVTQHPVYECAVCTQDLPKTSHCCSLDYCKRAPTSNIHRLLLVYFLQFKQLIKLYVSCKLYSKK